MPSKQEPRPQAIERSAERKQFSNYCPLLLLLKVVKYPQNTPAATDPPASSVHEGYRQGHCALTSANINRKL